MALFKKIDNKSGFDLNSYDPSYVEEYLVEGSLTEEDIEWIKSINRKIKLKFDNTKYLKSSDISRINNDNVMFSIDGGEKRNRESRKEITCLGLTTILYYFETIERELDPSWTDLQKSMYIYNVLCTDFEYTTQIKEDLTTNDLCRSLNGILYGKLTCAGFATVYKEFMDRIGVTCFYEGVSNVHRYNVLEIDGKYYGIDVTWDNNKTNGNKINPFKNFGTDTRFYYHYGHSDGSYAKRLSLDDIKFLKEKFNLEVPEGTYGVFWNSIESLYMNEKDFNNLSDSEILEIIKERLVFDISLYDKKGDNYFIPNNDEKRYDLSIFSDGEIESNLSVIRDRLDARKKINMDLSMSSESERKRFLPNSSFEEKTNTSNVSFDNIFKIREIFSMIDLLNTYGFNDDKYSEFKNLFGGMYSIALDMNNQKITSLDINGLIFNQDYIYESEDRKPIVMWQYKGMSNILDSATMVYKAKKDIEEILEKYLKKIIDEVLDNLSEYINTYDKYKNTKDEREDFHFIPAVIYAKFQPFIYYENELLKCNYRVEEVKNVSNILKSKFAFKEPTLEESIDYDKDFLYAVFSDLDDVKREFEYFEKRHLSQEEFLEKLYDMDYIRKVFILDSFHLSNDEYKNMFDEILSEKKVL